jgi:hypothetical protein
MAGPINVFYRGRRQWTDVSYLCHHDFSLRVFSTERVHVLGISPKGPLSTLSIVCCVWASCQNFGDGNFGVR